ncbi:MAG: adenosylmethionine--8-amino-7-oxononanoate transaminase, partial [Armatimonadetes bacterium]|nr:adenosylmethionine--8-amino-7-oxononanoate transaminase [Armatimonadota bacterium]
MIEEKTWGEKDKQYLWHPFTQMQDWVAGDPLIVAEGKGARLIDIEGREYFDGVSSLWVNVHGHRHPRIDQAVSSQLGRIAHSTMLGLTHVPAIRLAERLVSLAPEGLSRVFYSDSGSEAVEIALKMAFQYWRLKGRGSKSRFLALRNAYHGDTLGAVSVGGIDLFHSLFRPLLFDAMHAPSPYCYRCSLSKERESCRLACADVLEKLLGAHRYEIAAMIMEPLVQGASGMIVAPSGYLKRVREMCDRHEVLLITDEVATGFGRTGRMFASEHEGISPDILALAKGLTGGYLPLAATITTERIYEAFLGEFEEMKTFFHGHSYTGNPLACASAIANLEVFEAERTLEHVRKAAVFLHREMESFHRLRHVGDIRQCGLMVGIELVLKRDT